MNSPTAINRNRIQKEVLKSQFLLREVVVEVLIPKEYHTSTRAYKILVVNDGQDHAAFRLEDAILDFEAAHPDSAIVAFAVHVGERKQEYGVAGMPDFAQRGGRADSYGLFLERELFPWIHAHYRVLKEAEQAAMIGFSLGALSCFDQVWNHPHLFGAAGLFSGSFWWRAKDLNDGYTPEDRIILQMVAKNPVMRPIRFWFQTGWMDEAADRDDDGLIDSIGDTLDLILALKQIGYVPGKDIEYVELGYGHHDHKTMAKALPQFLEWFALS